MFLRKNVFFIFICVLMIGDRCIQSFVHVKNGSIKKRTVSGNCKDQHTWEDSAVYCIEHNNLERNRLQLLREYTVSIFEKETKQTNNNGAYNNPRGAYSLNFDQNNIN